MIIIADYLVLFTVFLCISVNRQSIFILCAFALNECAFYLTWSDFSFSILSACIYAALAKTLYDIKYELQMALAAYSVMFWFGAFDFWLTTQPTYFYVIFPYVVKLIDIYVIYHLIHKEQGCDRYNSTHRCTFN